MPEAFAQYEVVDAHLKLIREESERRCWKLRMNHTPWSMDYQKADDVTQLWNLVVRILTGKTRNMRLFR